jgi:hypothetical protein
MKYGIGIGKKCLFTNGYLDGDVIEKQRVMDERFLNRDFEWLLRND